jgi:hypothetical protein
MNRDTIREALEAAQAAVLDQHFGRKFTRAYVQSVDAQIRAALAALDAPEAPRPVDQYPCAKCGKTRTADQGGKIFTVCDECWEAPQRGVQETAERLQKIEVAAHDLLAALGDDDDRGHWTGEEVDALREALIGDGEASAVEVRP